MACQRKLGRLVVLLRPSYGPFWSPVSQPALPTRLHCTPTCSPFTPCTLTHTRLHRSLLYRSDREYDEAIKCYKNALRMDRENLTVMRDLALLQARPVWERKQRLFSARSSSVECPFQLAGTPLCPAWPVELVLPAHAAPLRHAARLRLQIQMRDMPGFLETRQTLLELKSNNKHNWISFALAHHLCGHHEVAVKVLESYEGEGERSRGVFGPGRANAGVRAFF